MDEIRHCPSCTCGKRAPLQGDHGPHGERTHGAGSIAWAEHLEAYAVYSAKYGTEQSPEGLAQRAGFGYREITKLLGHEPTTYVPGAIRW